MFQQKDTVSINSCLSYIAEHNQLSLCAYDWVWMSALNQNCLYCFISFLLFIEKVILTLHSKAISPQVSEEGEGVEKNGDIAA